MKKFLFKVGLFLLTLFVFDRSLGMVFSYMTDNAKGGYIGHHKYVTDKVNEDVLIFGSSRAIHHYNPKIITDSLGLTCYNCGQDGNGIILFYGLWQMIKEHHKPKLIIYDICQTFDLYKGESNQRYLGWLRGDYDRVGIKPIFTTIDPSEEYKMMSMLYRYNSKFMQVLTDYTHPIFRIEGNGYLPLKGEMDRMKIRDINKKMSQPHVDSLKIYFINKLIDELDGVKIIFVVSPTWYGSSNDTYQPIKEICHRRKIHFLDYSIDKKYIHQYQYFKDGTHLNDAGADEFTRDLIKELN